MRRPRPFLLPLCALVCAFTGSISAQDTPTTIGQIQGTGERSPLVGRAVTVAGVVTAAPDDSLGGWFLQDAGDRDPATSDALFVINDGGPPVGTRVRVHGTVVEADSGRGTRTALQPSG
ncbi:MAG: hypothetical protein WAZ48_16930, partial [Lysobacteraceae bacterium]